MVTIADEEHYTVEMDEIDGSITIHTYLSAYIPGSQLEIDVEGEDTPEAALAIALHIIRRQHPDVFQTIRDIIRADKRKRDSND